VAAENEPRQKVFPKTRRLVGLGNNDMVFYRDGDVAGENQVGDGVEQYPVFRLKIPGNKGIG